MAVAPLRLRFTVAEFRAYVKTLARPTWGVRCISLHHTYIPDEHTWHGQRSVDGIVAYWRTLGWSRWVHLFVALESGVGIVYVCNPLTLRGTGVRGRNADSIHIEHPWNGDVTPFDARLVAASNEVQAAVADWAGIPVQRIDPNPSVPDRGLFYHRWRRDAYKTCPGSRVGDADLIGRPQPEEDDMTPEQLDMLHRNRISAITGSYRIKMLEMRMDGAAPEAVAAVKVQMDEDIAAWKKRLGL